MSSSLRPAAITSRRDSCRAFVSQSSGSIITVTLRSLAIPSRSSTSVTCPAVVSNTSISFSAIAQSPPIVWNLGPPSPLVKFTSTSSRGLFAPVRGDLGIDVSARQAVEPAPLGTAPGFLQPVGRRRGGADEILHAHDDNGRLTAPVNDETLVVLGGEVHYLPELGAGDVCVDAAIHGLSMHQSINAS